MVRTLNIKTALLGLCYDIGVRVNGHKVSVKDLEWVSMRVSRLKRDHDYALKYNLKPKGVDVRWKKNTKH